MAAKRALRVLWFLALAHIAITWLLAIRRGWRARQQHDKTPPPPAVALPPVSVIVPAWNERGTIQRCIAALKNVEYPCWEALIVAGGDDGTFEVAQKTVANDERFRVLRRGPEPKNAALSQGTAVARFDVLVFLDADCIVEPLWLAGMVAPLTQGASTTLGDRLPSQRTWVTLADLMENIRAYEILGTILVQGDRSIGIRREALEKAGGLPTHTYAREDWDLGVRLDAVGEKIAYAKDARLVTDRPATLDEAWKMAVRWHRTHLTGMWEHRSTLLHTPGRAFNQLYGYILSLGLGLGSVVALILCLVWPSERSVILQLATMVTLWLGLRRASLGAEIAAYTGDKAWLRRCWMPVAMLGIELAASVAALLTPREQTPFYKGPRRAHD